MQHLRALAVAAAIAISSVACSNSPSSPTLSGGNFNLRLRDTPFTDAKAVLVTFSSVRAHRTDTDWTVVPFINAATSWTCDLKKLQTSEDILASAALPAGHYTQVRLVVQNATLFFDNASSGAACASSITTPAGANATIDIPSGEVRLTREFDTPTSGAKTMLLDFDGDGSIHATGNGRFMMTPVITILSVN